MSFVYFKRGKGGVPRGTFGQDQDSIIDQELEINIHIFTIHSKQIGECSGFIILPVRPLCDPKDPATNHASPMPVIYMTAVQS